MTRLVAVLLVVAMAGACTSLAPPDQVEAQAPAAKPGDTVDPEAPVVAGSLGPRAGGAAAAFADPALPAMPADAAPASAAPTPTPPPPPPTLAGELRSGFALDHAVDERAVRQHVDWLRRHPEYLSRLQPRVETWLPWVCAQVRERGLPAELCLLPIIESALDPFAFSPGGAAGLWQFIPATAKRYGLRMDWWVDERRDPLAATAAALDYLETLHARFGDWTLAVAAYNCGEGRVERALRRAGADADFFALELPRETAAYVPRLLAFAAVVDDPQAHGVALPFDDVPAFAQHTVAVDTGGQIDVALAAEAIGIGVDEVYALNPGLNQWATHPAGPHRLLVPADRADQAQRALAAIAPDERVAWIRHQIRPNETLGGLALTYGTDVATLRRVNGLDGSRIRAGDHLMIPKASRVASAYPTPGRARASRGTEVIVERGDSLWSIAQRYGVSTQTLMRSNHIGPNDVLRVGQKIVVPGDGPATPARETTVRTVRYRVRSGDSLAAIAGKFNVSIGQIAGWNAIDPAALIHPGQRLVLHVDVAAPRT